MEKQISLIDFIRLCLHRWWALLIGLIVGAIISGVITIFFITPVYTVTGTLYAENSNDAMGQNIHSMDLNTLVVRKELVGTYAEILRSNAFLKKVAERSGLDYTYNDLQGMLSMQVINETEILAVRITNPNPQHAYIITQTLMNMADEQVGLVIEGSGMKILDEPNVPEFPSSPNVLINIMIGAFAGLVISLLIVFLIDMFDKKVKDAVHLSEYFDYPVLGEIPFLDPVKEHSEKKKQPDAVNNA